MRGLASLLVVTACAGCGGDTTPGDGSGGDGSVPLVGCPALPAPSGATRQLTPADDLAQVVFDAAPGTTLVLADGTYMLSATLQIHARGVTLRGASDDATRVMLDAGYVVAEAIQVSVPDVTIAHVTITHAVDHAIHVSPPDGGPDVTGFVMYGVDLVDNGEQFLKVNPPAARNAFVDGGRVECSRFVMTDGGRPHVERNPGGCYTGGIDAHSARGWVVRRNRFDSIYCAGEGLAEHAIHFWVSGRDTLVENNTIIDCARGIGFGLGATGNGFTRVYADDPYPGVGYVGHYDGIIRNNVIWASTPFFDTGISLEQAMGARVLHNTIASADSATGFFSSLDYRFANSVVTLANNLTRRITMRDGATATRATNLESADLTLFANATGGDFHLATGATPAIDQGTTEPDPGLDLDGEPHTRGAPDIGADER
jgi:hypothetical protein